MTFDVFSSPNNRNARLSEFWLTPVIGLILMGPLIYHWRLHLADMAGPAFTDDWRMQLRKNIGLDIAIGIIPLFTTAYVQSLLRAWKWNDWAQWLGAGLIGCLLVGIFYYYALYPLPHWSKPNVEGEGNVMVIYNEDIFCLAILAGSAVFISTFAISVVKLGSNSSTNPVK